VLVFHSGGEGDEEDDSSAGTLVAGGSNSKAIFIDLAHPFSAPIEVSTGGNNRADDDLLFARSLPRHRLVWHHQQGQRRNTRLAADPFSGVSHH
jgi:hypothetical protein